MYKKLNTQFKKALLASGLAVAPLSGLLFFNTAYAATENSTSLTLPSGALGDTLLAINSAFDRAIIASEKLVSDKISPAIKNAPSAEVALDIALQGSGLQWSTSASGALIVTEKNDNASISFEPDSSTSLESVSVERITVTALKRQALLKDVPISLSVFDEEEIIKSNLVSFEDYAMLTPNLSFQNNGGGARTIFSLRGVGGGNIASGTGTPVGFYVDEIILNPTGGLRQNDLALFDLERVEILRGPQGTLFGRNTIGGAINLVTRKPDDEFSARLITGVEEFGTRSVQGHVNLAVTDSLFMQASGIYRDTDGFIENTTTGESLGSGGEGSRVALRYLPNDRLSIDVSAMQNKVLYDGLQSVTEEDFNAGRLETALPFQVENFVDSELYSARIEYAASHFDVISLSSYNQFNARETFDITGLLGPIPAYAEIDIAQENIAQELRLQSDNEDTSWNWLLGVNYTKTKDSNDTTAIAGTPDAPIQVAQIQTGTSEAENSAIFASLDFALSDAYTLTVGGRYSRDEYEFVDPNGEFFEGSSNAFTPSVTLQYSESEDWMFYSTISRGYRPGGVDTSFFDLSPEDNINSEYNPEKAWNYEVGVNASLFKDKLIMRGNLFFMDYEDIQAAFFIPPDNLDTITSNGAAAETKGAEFEVHFFATQHLTFNLNLGLLDSEFTEFADSPEGDLTGNELPYAPRVTLSLVGEYRKPIGDNLEGYFRTEYTRRSDQEGRNNNNAIERQPGYELINIRLGLVYNNMEFEIYGENAADEEYFTNRRLGPIVTVTPGRPVAFGARAIFRF